MSQGVLAETGDAAPGLRLDDTTDGFQIPRPGTRSAFEEDASGDSSDEVALERLTDPDQIPDAVRDLRDKLIEAAKTGDVTKLGRYIEPGANGTLLSVDESYDPANEVDPIEFLRQTASEPQALETLAILIDILSSDPVRFGAGTRDEAYVWPWFWGRSLESLNAQETTELLRIVTWGDLEIMQASDSYTFYRAGISPDGRLRFFLTGD